MSPVLPDAGEEVQYSLGPVLEEGLLSVLCALGKPPSFSCSTFRLYSLSICHYNSSIPRANLYPISYPDLHCATGVLHSTEHHILVFPSEAQAMRGVVKFKYVQKRGGNSVLYPILKPRIAAVVEQTLYYTCIIAVFLLYYT